MRGKNILSLSLILMFITVVTMNIRSVQAATYEYELYVDGFDWTICQWTTVGSPPWLDATDDGNYIESSEYCSLIGFFTFEDIDLEPGKVIAKVVLEGYTRSQSLDIDCDVYSSDWEWVGSLWGNSTWAWHTPKWIPVLSDEVRDTLTVAGLNNFKVMLHYFTPEHTSYGPFEIDCLRLRVYTAISATIDIDPDTVKLTSNAPKLKCNITLPSGFSACDINQSTIVLDNLIAPKWFDQPTDSSLMVKFNMTTVKEHIENDLLGEEPLPQDVTLYVTFSLKNDGPPFAGNDTITVISCPKH